MSLAAYLKVEGVDGQSQNDKHQKWIEVRGYDHLVQQSAVYQSGTGLVVGETNHGVFKVTKYIDKASPKLSYYCSSGTAVAEVKLELCKAAGANQVKYMEYKLTNAIIASVRPSGDKTSAEEPLEEVTFRYERIDWTYSGTGAESGDVKTWWDIPKHKGQ